MRDIKVSIQNSPAPSFKDMLTCVMNDHDVVKMQDMIEPYQILHLGLHATGGTASRDGIYNSISLFQVRL